MTTPAESSPQATSSEVECDSVFDYCDRVRQQARGDSRRIVLRTIELDHGDGDVGIYDRAGNFLACEEGREAAIKEAHFVVTAYVNDTTWAAGELLAGRGHLQKHFPKIAEQHGCPRPDPVAPSLRRLNDADSTSPLHTPRQRIR